jgi:DinB superfamily
MSELPDLLERFRRGAEVLAAMLTGVANPEADFRMAQEKWTIRQIMAHVSDAEIAAAFRFRHILAEESPKLEAFDENLWASRLDYERRKPSQSLETFRRIRQENYELLKELPPSEFQRTGVHSERGTVTLVNLLKMMAEHPEAHARQIRAVRDAYKLHRSANA